MPSARTARRWAALLLSTTLACAAGILAHRPVVAQTADVKVDFAHDILPILKARCAECHTNGKYRADLSLDTREDLLKSKVAKLKEKLPEDLIKDMKTVQTQGWGKVTPVLAPLPGEPY